MLLSLLLAVVGATPAGAAAPAEALRMAWDDCPIGDGAMSNKAFTCDTNIGSQSLYCAFSLLQPVDQVIGLEIVVDVQHSLTQMPDYWRLGPSPDCRNGLLTASVDFTGTTACEGPGFTGAVVQDYVVTEPRGQTSQARIKAVVFVPSPQVRSLGNDTTYHAVRLVFSNDRTVNVNVCADCTSPACLVFNSIWVRRVSGAFGGDVFVSTPGPASSNWAYWRGGAGADCKLVPVRNMTWGSIKSLYR